MSQPAPGTPCFRVGFVAGVMPDKWARTWREREPRQPLDMFPLDDADPVALLRDGDADMCFVRLPVDRDALHAITLYDEVPVVVVPLDHPVTAYDEVSLADLAGEQLVTDPAQVPGWEALDSPPRLDWPEMTLKDAVEVVASGTGIVIVPMSLARLHHRKDVVHRPVSDGPVSSVALVWLRDGEDDPRVETFVGIVRGRRAQSSRGSTGRAVPDPKKPPTPVVSKATPSRGRRRPSPRTTRAARPRRAR